MTIKQYAEKLGISPQAVYQRLKKNKIRIESLTEKGSGEISGEGMIVLDKLFSPESMQKKPPKDELIEALEKQISDLRTENSTKDEKIKGLEAETRRCNEEIAFLRKALEKEQENYSNAMQRLLPAGPKSESTRLTWRERFTGRRNG